MGGKRARKPTTGLVVSAERHEESNGHRRREVLARRAVYEQQEAETQRSEQA